mgnify:CR=1 FL=1
MEEIKKIIDDHENRIKKLEEIIFSRKQTGKTTKKDYKGLAGGIRLLINNGFLNEPKSVKEIMSELKREGYHNSQAGVASTLSVTFTKSQKVLNRIDENKVWKYVLRK